MKVLLVGEGPSELGGALQTLVTRLGLVDCEFDCDRVQAGVHAHHGKGKGYFKRAVRWMLEAQKRGYDALILVIDRDKHPERVRELAEAQEYAGAAIRRALGVAIRTFDAWMLADERASTQVLGYAVSRQPEPERINHPKEVCQALLDHSQAAMSPTEMYAALALVVDLSMLEGRCPEGFAPFAQRVRALQEKIV